MCIGLHIGAYNANFGGMCWKIQRKRIAVIAKDGKLLIMKLVEAESQRYSYLSVSHRGEWPELTQDMSLYGHILTEERWWPDRTPAEITGNARGIEKRTTWAQWHVLQADLCFTHSIKHKTGPCHCFTVISDGVGLILQLQMYIFELYIQNILCSVSTAIH